MRCSRGRLGAGSGLFPQIRYYYSGAVANSYKARLSELEVPNKREAERSSEPRGLELEVGLTRHRHRARHTLRIRVYCFWVEKSERPRDKAPPITTKLDAVPSHARHLGPLRGHRTRPTRRCPSPTCVASNSFFQLREASSVPHPSEIFISLPSSLPVHIRLGGLHSTADAATAVDSPLVRAARRDDGLASPPKSGVFPADLSPPLHPPRTVVLAPTVDPERPRYAPALPSVSQRKQGTKRAGRADNVLALIHSEPRSDPTTRQSGE